MAYEEVDGDIKLFVGRKYEYSLRQQRNSGVKKKIKYPSLEGYVVINGEQKRIAMWTWTSKKTGKKFWSGKVELEEEKQVKRSRRQKTEP